MISKLNILLVSGTGRNCGKTTIACELISHFSHLLKVVGLKVSPHFHQTSSGQRRIYSNADCAIYEETDKNSGKDSSRMLEAGASKVYYIQCTDSNLDNVIAKLNEIIPSDTPVICESGSFGLYYNPGIHIMIHGNGYSGDKKSANINMEKADMIINQESIIDTSWIDNIIFEKERWIFKHNY